MPDSNPLIVPRQIVEDFETVATFYRLRELGEYENAKQAARDDMDRAAQTFAVLAQEIREGRA